MRSGKEPTPRVSIKERVEVILSKDEVEHCLRCWLKHKLAPIEAPRAKEFDKIEILFEMGGDGDMESVTLFYEPAPRRQAEE